MARGARRVHDAGVRVVVAPVCGVSPRHQGGVGAAFAWRPITPERACCAPRPRTSRHRPKRASPAPERGRSLIGPERARGPRLAWTPTGDYMERSFEPDRVRRASSTSDDTPASDGVSAPCLLAISRDDLVGRRCGKLWDEKSDDSPPFPAWPVRLRRRRRPGPLRASSASQREPLCVHVPALTHAQLERAGVAHARRLPARRLEDEHGGPLGREPPRPAGDDTPTEPQRGGRPARLRRRDPDPHAVAQQAARLMLLGARRRARDAACPRRAARTAGAGRLGCRRRDVGGAPIGLRRAGDDPVRLRPRAVRGVQRTDRRRPDAVALGPRDGAAVRRPRRVRRRTADRLPEAARRYDRAAAARVVEPDRLCVGAAQRHELVAGRRELRVSDVLGVVLPGGLGVVVGEDRVTSLWLAADSAADDLCRQAVAGLAEQRVLAVLQPRGLLVEHREAELGAAVGVLPDHRVLGVGPGRARAVVKPRRPRADPVDELVPIRRELGVKRPDGQGVGWLADQDGREQRTDLVTLAVELDELEPAAGEDRAVVGLRGRLVGQLLEAVGGQLARAGAVRVGQPDVVILDVDQARGVRGAGADEQRGNGAEDGAEEHVGVLRGAGSGERGAGRSGAGIPREPGSVPPDYGARHTVTGAVRRTPQCQRGRASAAGRDGASRRLPERGSSGGRCLGLRPGAQAAPGRVTGGCSGAGRRAAEHLDAVTAGDREHVREVRWPGERRGLGGVARGLAELGEERLEAAGRQRDEEARVAGAGVAVAVRRVGRDDDGVTRRGRRLAAVGAEDDERAVEDVERLARRVAVQRRAAARRHDDLEHRERAAGLLRGDLHVNEVAQDVQRLAAARGDAGVGGGGGGGAHGSFLVDRGVVEDELDGVRDGAPGGRAVEATLVAHRLPGARAAEREDEGTRGGRALGVGAVEHGRQRGLEAGEPGSAGVAAELTAARRREHGAGQRLMLVEVSEHLRDGGGDRLGADVVREVGDAVVEPLREPVEQCLARREVAEDGALRDAGAAGEPGDRELLEAAGGQLGAKRLEDHGARLGGLPLAERGGVGPCRHRDRESDTNTVGLSRATWAATVGLLASSSIRRCVVPRPGRSRAQTLERFRTRVSADRPRCSSPRRDSAAGLPGDRRARPRRRVAPALAS